MATAVGMNFKMTASIAKFQASMDKVESKLAAIDRSSRESAKGMKLLAAIEVGRSVLNGLTGLFNIFKSGVSSVVQFSSEAAAAADAIGKLSAATGMAEEPLQVFTQLASYSGVSSEQFGQAVQKMSRGLGEAANGTGTAARALKSLGISIDTLLKMSPEQQFATIASAIGDIEDPARKSAVAADIFGRSGTKLIPMFEDFEANAKATGDEMLRLGQVLSGTQIDNIEAMNDSFERVRQTAFKIGTQVLANFAPMIEDANNALLEFVKNFEFDGEIGGQALANFLTEAFFDGAEILAKWGDDFLNALSALVDRFADAFEYVFGEQKIETPAIQKWNDEIAEYAEQIRHSLIQARKGLETQSEHERRVQALRAAIAENQEKIKEEERRVLTKKREYNTGLGSMQDSLAEARKAFEESSKSSQQRQDKVNAAFDKTIANAEAAAANPAYDALEKEFGNIAGAAARATDPVDLFGKTNGIAGDQLKQLALDAEKFGPNAQIAREALDGMKNASERASSELDLFGRGNGIAGDALRALAIEEENRRATAERLRKEEDARLRKNLGAWDQTADRLQRFYESLGMDPAWLEKRRQAERQAYETNLKAFYAAKKQKEDEIAQRIKDREDKQKERQDKLYADAYKRAEERKKLQEQAKKDYEAITQFGKSLNDWFGGGEGEGPEFPEGETTLPELQTQTTTLGGILDAVKNFGSNFVTATIG